MNGGKKQMLAIEMPRKDTKLRLDERILSALREKADESGMSFNALCETILFSYAKSVGKLPPDAEPLPEARGGARPNAGKRKKSEDADFPTDDRSDTV
ncbi:hypothetical protein H6F89_03495 [Cyanobacteria bacterium FACHB-63]|nr:hypothetical protein [Cyanobacteria bacterium FACHB-63]